jgi:hypothetical protein
MSAACEDSYVTKESRRATVNCGSRYRIRQQKEDSKKEGRR